MIRINLLPVEKRKVERTPLPRLTLIMATAAAATGLFLYIAWVYLEIRKTEEEIVTRTNELKEQQKKLPEFTALTDKRNKLKAKVEEIDALSKRNIDVGWWRAINALWDVINNHPRVWIDELRVVDEKSIQTTLKGTDPDDKMAPPYGVTLRCHVAGDEVSEMTKFRTALKANPTLLEVLTFLNISVDWKIDDEKDFDIKSSISFIVTLAGPTAKPKTEKGPAGGGAAAVGAPAPAPAPGTGGAK